MRKEERAEAGIERIEEPGQAREGWGGAGRPVGRIVARAAFWHTGPQPRCGRASSAVSQLAGTTGVAAAEYFCPEIRTPMELLQESEDDAQR